MSDKLFEWLFGVMARPAATLNEIAREKPAGLAVLVYVGVNVMAGLASFFVDQTYGSLQEVMAELNIYLPISVVMVGIILLPFAMLFISCLLIHLVCRLFGGTGGYWNLLSAYGFASFPIIIIVPVSFLAGFLGFMGSIFSGVVSFGLSIWILVLNVFAIRESHGLSTGLSILAYMIHFVILIAIPVAIAITLVVALLAF